jgi:uncharacterized membrane protein
MENQQTNHRHTKLSTKSAAIRFASWQNLALLFLLVAATVLRLYDLGSRSYFNDELSALYRLEGHAGLKELITEGVTPDFHPAGVQVFLWYWQKVAGDHPFLMRLPFAMAGIVSVWLVFLLGTRWFGRTTALMTAASLALLQFPLVYSQMIRPYSTGMMLILAATLCWDRIVFAKTGTPTKKLILPAAGMALLFAGAMYNHYFSFLMVAGIGITGLLLAPRKHMSLYLAAGLIPVILFLPHLQISVTQISRGGLSTWLPPPEISWIKEHLFHLFNNSVWLTLMVIVPAFIVTGYRFLSKQTKPNTTRLVVVWLWYLVPFAFAYIYSITVNPIIQHSIMLFAFPFLLLALFAGFVDQKGKAVLLLTLILPLLMVAHLLAGSRYYQHTPYTNFKTLGAQICEQTTRGAAWMVDVNHPWYIHYYLDERCPCDSALRYRISGHAMIPEISRLLDTLPNERLVYAWMRPADPIVPAVIRQHYPYLISYQNQYPYAELFVFSRHPENIIAENYTRDTLLLTQSHPTDSSTMNRIEAEFLPIFEGSLPPTDYGRGNILLHCEVVFSPDKALPEDLTLVIHGMRPDGTPGEWYGINLNTTRTAKGLAFHSVSLPHDFNHRDPIKVYLWNPAMEPYRVQSFALYWLRDAGRNK